MRKFPYMAAAMLVALFSWHCEKDDICDENTVTTPRLILHFYDKENPTQEKNVSNLKVTGDGVDTPLRTFTATAEIQLPLSTIADTAGYTMILNSTSATPNEDHIQIHYSRESLYVSRACGYRAVFDLDPENPFVVEDSGGDLLWIYETNVEQTQIRDENEVHISVYF